MIGKIINKEASPEEIKFFIMQIARYVLLTIISILSIKTTFHWTSNKFDTHTVLLLTGAVEFGLVVFAWKTNNVSKLYGFVWLGFLVYSIIASRSDIVESLLHDQQQEIHSSPEYTMYQKEKDTNLDEKKTLKIELDSLIQATSSGSIQPQIDNVNQQILDLNNRLEKIPAIKPNLRTRSDIETTIENLKGSRKILVGLANSDKDAKDKVIKRKDAITTRMKELDAKNTALDIEYNKKNNNSSPLSEAGEENYWTVFFIFLEIVRMLLLKDINSYKMLNNLISDNDDNDPKRKKKKTEKNEENSSDDNKSFFDFFKRDKKENITTAKNDDSPTPSENEDENLDNVGTEFNEKVRTKIVGTDSKVGTKNNKKLGQKVGTNVINIPSWDTLKSSVPTRSGQKKNKVSQLSQDKKTTKKINEIDLTNCLNFGKKQVGKYNKFPTRTEIANHFNWTDRYARKVLEELKKRNIIETGRRDGKQGTWFIDKQRIM